MVIIYLDKQISYLRSLDKVYKTKKQLQNLVTVWLCVVGPTWV